MTSLNDKVSRTVADCSQCICEVSNEVPCWKCHYDAFNVYWFAKWGKDAVRLTNARYDAQDACYREHTYTVLVPSAATFVQTTRTIRDRHLLRVPYEVEYFPRLRRWTVAGPDVNIKGEDDEPLDKLLTSYNKLINIRDEGAIKGQILWAQSNRLNS